jgi:ribosomal protein S18 acetylase RimI-like enzyme
MYFKNFEIDDIENFIKFINYNKEDTLFFHPHKFDYESIKYILENKKEDIYLLLCENDIIIGYGLLRGWNEGYKIPSLGIMVDKEYRGKGYSKKIIFFLHEIAKNKNSEYVRLTVKKDNILAMNLYKKIGYEFNDYKNNSLEGILKIK